LLMTPVTNLSQTFIKRSHLGQRTVTL